MGSIEFGTSQLNIQDVLEAEWCGLKGSISYSLYDFHSKTFLILIDLFCIIGILQVEPFFRLVDFGVLEKDFDESSTIFVEHALHVARIQLRA